MEQTRQELEVPKNGTQLPENNAYVLEAHRSEKTGNIYVLLLLPGTIQPFATGLYVGRRGWISGHYFENINEALYDFLERG